MKQPVLGIDGQPKGEVELSDAVFDADVSEGAIYYAIRNELANRRVGTAKTKERGEVRYSNRKPWRQKGTGRARAGDRKSPIWVGGGTTFGPQPRDFSYKLPRKAKHAAIRGILSGKRREERLTVVEDFAVDTGKTKDLVKILEALMPAERAVVILPGRDADKMVRRAGGNVHWVRFMSYNQLLAHDLFYGQRVVVTESAATALNDFYAKAATSGQAGIAAKEATGDK